MKKQIYLSLIMMLLLTGCNKKEEMETSHYSNENNDTTNQSIQEGDIPNSLVSRVENENGTIIFNVDATVINEGYECAGIYHIDESTEKRDMESNGWYVLKQKEESENETLYAVKGIGYEKADTLYGANQCDIELSQKTADTYISELGYDNLCLSMVNRILVEDKKGNIYQNGYQFVYVFGDNNLQAEAYIYNKIVQDASYVLYSTTGTGIAQPCVVIETKDEKITYAEESIKYGSVECLEHNAKLLSFDQTERIAEEFMSKTVMSGNNGNGLIEYNIGEIRLSYISMNYGGKICVVPVWVYLQDINVESSEIKNAVFGVNAVDGSIVRFMGESKVRYY